MKKLDISSVLNHLTNFIELIVALVLIGSISVYLLLIFKQFPFSDSANFDFFALLTQVTDLIIALEFTRMLCRHTPETIIDILLFAIGRQLILHHGSSMDILLGVISISILFAVRKILLSNSESEQKNAFLLNLKQINSRLRNITPTEKERSNELSS